MFRRFAALLLGVVAVLFATGTTTASATRSIYDGPAVARVDAQAFTPSDASPTHLSRVRVESASPLPSVRGTSTTPFAPVVATNTADDFVNLASDVRTSHILDGHMPPGMPGKSLFPSSWVPGHRRCIHSLNADCPNSTPRASSLLADDADALRSGGAHH
jgi:hypothetical protein